MADDNSKDIDFDELHQAVNALMDKAQKGGSKPKTASVSVKDEPVKADEPVAQDEPVASDEPAPVAVAPDPVAAAPSDDDSKVMVSVKRPTAPVLNQHKASHGRAMDVVSPRSKPEIAPPSASAKREALTLQPTHSDVKPEPVASVVVAPDHERLADDKEDSSDLNEALAKLDMQATAKSISGPTMTHQKSEWPDPLDLAADDKKPDDQDEPADDAAPAESQDDHEEPEEQPGPIGEPAEEPEEPAQPEVEAPAEEPEDDHEEPPSIEPDEPDEAPTEPAAPSESEESEEKADSPEEPKDETSNSPFVTTKVEKRPLGAYADAIPAEPQVKPEDSPQPAQPANDASVPNADQKDTPNSVPMIAQPAELSPAVVAVESAEPEFSPTDAPEPESSDKGDLRTMAIPQQYKETEKPEEESTRPVFDTKEYHPAIEAHTTPHRSSVGTWAMALILLGLLVGVLAAAYYFITGGLDFSALL